MSTEFRLYNVSDSELYCNQSAEIKKRLQPQIVEMAKKRGIKPTARYFKTYPSTVRRILKKYNTEDNK